ncbi:MAG TPA: ParB/RepB/Spo0J family partition protein [Pseudoxanthomonas sp.]|nr:ParB/RepB/Spo0J family partition protein [Pseudoxanthomonas sp.]
MSAPPNLLHVHLSQLQLSPLNARKTGGQDIDGLAASIEAHGLLQNLSVATSTHDTDRYEVIAGGRRLAALQRLEREGRLSPDYRVPVRIIHDDSVLEASTAENTLREAMHPADQFEAFKGMVEAKKSIPDIAAHFGVSELVVKQRLKLANVAPTLVQIYRDGGMDLEQLQAFAISDSHAQQERAWFDSDGYDRHAYNIRRRLTHANVSANSMLARFVGLEAYEAAGGGIAQDLFSNREDAFLTDRTLLESLAMDQLEAIAQCERDAGWSWAQARISMDYNQLAEYPHCGAEPKIGKPNKEDSERIEAINARLAEIEDLQEGDQDAHDEDDPRCLDDDTREELENETDTLEEERAVVSRRSEVWPASVMATAGVVVYLDQDGLRIARGRLQPGQKVSASGEVTGTPNAAGSKPEPPRKVALSQDMITRLEMHRAAAIREHVAADPHKAMTLLLTHLALRLVTTSGSEAGLSLAPTNAHSGATLAIGGKFGCLGTAPARKALDDRLAQLKKDGMPSTSAPLFEWIGTRSDTQRLALLALLTALTVDTNPGKRGEGLANEFGVDMATWWAPTADTYLTLVPKALLAEAVADVDGKRAGEAILALKKDAAIAAAAKALTGKGWLPKPLRGPGYGTKKAAAKPTPTKAKKAPAKKAVKPAKKAAKTVPKKKAVAEKAVRNG